MVRRIIEIDQEQCNGCGACAAACPKNAIIFGNWLDEGSPLVRAAKNRVLYAPKAIAALDPAIVYMRGRR